MINSFKKATPPSETTRAEKIQLGISSQGARNKVVKLYKKHKKVDFKSGKFLYFLCLFLKDLIKLLGSLVGASLILFVLAYFVPLRDILPNFYVWVDAILNCFDKLCSFLNYLFTLLTNLLFG